MFPQEPKNATAVFLCWNTAHTHLHSTWLIRGIQCLYLQSSSEWPHQLKNTWFEEPAWSSRLDCMTGRGRAAIFSTAELWAGVLRGLRRLNLMYRGWTITEHGNLHTSITFCVAIDVLLFVWWKAWKMSSPWTCEVWSFWRSTNTSTHKLTQNQLENDGLSRLWMLAWK